MAVYAGLRIILAALLYAAALAEPATARPTGPIVATFLAPKADTIVIGRITAAAFPTPQRCCTDSTMFDGTATLRAAAILKAPSAKPGPFLTLHIHSFNTVGKNSFAIFFLNHAGDGTYTNADTDHWFLEARRSAPERAALPADPVAAIAQEMLAILATPPMQITSRETGVNCVGEPLARSGADAIYAEAMWALEATPPGLVEPALRRLAMSPNPQIRLWCTASLISHGDFTALPASVPALLAPTRQIASAAWEVASMLEDQDTVPATLSQPLMTLLGSSDAQLRAAAAHALGRVSTQAVIHPLADAIQREPDVEAMRSEMDALCRATGTDDAPCDKITWIGYGVENPPLWRQWAKAHASAHVPPPI